MSDANTKTNPIPLGAEEGKGYAFVHMYNSELVTADQKTLSCSDVKSLAGE